MPYTDFHYTPTGTGVISGKEVLEQTEDAINDLGGQISGDVQTAIDTANNALNVANTASADAQNAVNTANTAYTAATNAQNTANAAQNTASNALTAAQNAQNDVNALGNRVTTAENNITQNTTDISGLTTRMGTAEGNITTLQNDVVTAQGTATSAQNTATMARQQSYVFRYSSTALTPSSTNSNTLLDNTDNLKVGDKVIDSSGVLFSVTAIDTANSTFTIGTALIDLAQDSDVVHNSGNEIVNGDKTFSNSVTVKNSNVSGASRSFVSISRTVEIGDTNNGDSTRFIFLDKNNSEIAFLRLRKLTNSNNDLGICVNNIDTNNNNISAEINLVLDRNNDARISASVSDFISLGRQFSKWKSVWTSQINGLTPSILSLPNYAQRMDILGYITDLTGGNNIYTPVANGYIYLRTDSGLMLEILDVTTGIGSSSIVQSNDKLRIFLPVIAQRNVYIKANCTSLVSAVFVPCCGNI